MDDVPYQPPLTPWGHVWRATLCGLGGLLVWVAGVGDPGAPAWATVLDPLLGVVGLYVVTWRRRYPVAVMCALTLAGYLSDALTFTTLLAFVSVVTRKRWREIVVVCLVQVLSLPLVYLQPWDRAALQVSAEDTVLYTVALPVTALVAFAAVIAFGLFIGSRRELLWTLRDRAERAERDRETRSLAARQQERTRIAREMHDVLAHRLSLVTMYTGAMTFRTDLDAEALRESARTVHASSQEAMRELRQILGVLRDDEGQTTAPQQQAVDLSALWDEVRAGGQTLDVSCGVDLAALDVAGPSTGRALYRIVQECLTNARKHAPGVRVRVQVHGGAADGVHVRVGNPVPLPGVARRSGPAPGPDDDGQAAAEPDRSDPSADAAVPSDAPAGTGYGLIGLRERAALLGGRVEVTRTSRTFTVEAWLPWPT